MADSDLLNGWLSDYDFLRNNDSESVGGMGTTGHSWRRRSWSSKSLSSDSTDYTSRIDGRKSPKHFNWSKCRGNDASKHKELDRSKILEIIYEVVSDLYEEEIVPTIHEIRRKIRKKCGFSFHGENIIKMCRVDSRFEVLLLNTSGGESKDVQNDWAILFKDRPLSYFNKEIDLDILSLVYNFIIFICSNRYQEITDSLSEISGDSDAPSCYEFNSSFDLQTGLVPFKDIINIGGRYIFAEYLKTHGPSELRRLSLGSIINLVQKLSEMGVLVYNGSCLVPVVSSRTAANKLILNLSKSFNQDNLDHIRSNFFALFTDNAEINLSYLPILYKMTYDHELNYSEIGYEKLSDFIKAEVPSLKISFKDKQFVVSLSSESGEIDPAQKTTETPDSSGKPNYLKLLGHLIASNTTVLYPLKITPL